MTHSLNSCIICGNLYSGDPGLDCNDCCQTHGLPNRIDNLDWNILELIGSMIDTEKKWIWELACHGYNTIFQYYRNKYLEAEERENEEMNYDLDRWASHDTEDFDLYENWYGDCYVNNYGERIHNTRFSADEFRVKN